MAIDYKRLALAETDPARIRLLEELDAVPDGKAVSSGDLCKTLGSTTSQVVYHLGVLEGKGLVECTGTQQVGGEVHRYFRLPEAVSA